MMKEIIGFSLRLFAILFLTLAIHLFMHSMFQIELTADLILESYLTNFLMVIATYSVLVYFREKKSKSLALIFLIGFFFKIAVFLIFFKPIYKADDLIQSTEFFAFFIPYSLSLVYETYIIIRILNNSEND